MNGACPQIACQPKGEVCGDNFCGPDEQCCSASCGICGPKGGVCPQIQCKHDGQKCGNAFCHAGDFCCNAGCSQCEPQGSRSALQTCTLIGS